MVAPVFFGLVVGLSLGLTGGGGSIFAVPLLVYGLGLDFHAAVAVSLMVVGAVAAFGATVHGIRREVLWGAGLMLGLGGLLSAPLGAALGRALSDRISLGLFALVMVGVGYPMVRGGGIGDRLHFDDLRCPLDPLGRPSFSPRCATKLLISGVVVGVLSGLFGVGGGFLIVPALLMVLPIKFETALTSSLVSITVISISGVVAHRSDLSGADPTTVLLFFTGGLVGMLTGIRLKSRLDRARLRRIFGGITLGAAFLVLALAATR
ncbi:MAG: hypothetical protein RL417_629 [Pseudomonadota bacterium]